jgi:hypothetical protein
MMTAEQNYRLLQEIDANRRFLLLALQGNPHLLALAEGRVRQALLAVRPETPPTPELIGRTGPGITP